MGLDDEKAAAGEAAAAMVKDRMRVGLGTGSTVAYFVPALAARALDIVCIATSPATEELARQCGLRLEEFGALGSLDMTIDGADQVAPSGWLVKGGGGAHTRERIVAAAATQFVVIVSSNKLVERISPPVPLELDEAAVETVLASVPDVQTRPDSRMTPDGGILADYFGPVRDPAEVASWLSAVPGVVSHGLFPPSMVSRVLIGSANQVEVFVPPT